MCILCVYVCDAMIVCDALFAMLNLGNTSLALSHIYLVRT